MASLRLPVNTVKGLGINTEWRKMNLLYLWCLQVLFLFTEGALAKNKTQRKPVVQDSSCYPSSF